jgi:acyl-CoA synthetase (NDP forming)
MEKLLRPRSIAIIGASPTPGALGASVLTNLERAGYAGAIHLVNPKRTEINGRSCVASVAALPHGVDCAIMAIPRAGVLESLRACGEQGVGSAVIFSAGFAEDGEAGRAAQAEIAAIAQQYNMIIEGPNCLGLVNYVDNVPLTFVDIPGKHLSHPRGIAIVSQSGAMAAVVSVVLASRDIGISHFVSTGNEAANGVEDFVEYLLESPTTQSILMVVEQFRAPARFLKLVARARAKNIPILLLHPGKSAAARKSAETHTGAMAGDDPLMRMKLAHAGVAIADTLEELGDLAELVFRCAAPPVGGTAVLAESGAFKALTLDFCESIGLELPSFSETTFSALREAMPAFIQPSNPLDLTAHGLVEPDLYRRTLLPLLADPALGALMLAIILTNEATSNLKMGPIIEALTLLKPTKPVIFAGLDEGAVVEAHHIAALRQLGIPFFPSTERALRALKRFTDLGRPQRATRPPQSRAAQSLPSGVLPEYRSKKILTDWNIAIPTGGFAATLRDAEAIACRIGYPVVLKAQAAALSHKSDAGGVVLNLADSAALAAGWAQLYANVAAARPDITLDGVLVERMGSRGFELIVGARRDPEWGAVILVGAGGVLAEAIHDVRLLPPDLTESAIVDELMQLKSAVLFKGFRGSPALDISAAAQIVARLGALIEAHPEITEIDVNPVVVYPAGEGALALDGLIFVT